MTDLSPTPLTQADITEVKPLDLAAAREAVKDVVAAELQAERPIGGFGCAERDERIEALRKALDSDTECFELAEEREQKLEERIAALEARNAALVGLLREWRSTADVAKDLTFVPIAKRTDAALTEQRGGKHE